MNFFFNTGWFGWAGPNFRQPSKNTLFLDERAESSVRAFVLSSPIFPELA